MRLIQRTNYRRENVRAVQIGQNLQAAVGDERLQRRIVIVALVRQPGLEVGDGTEIVRGSGHGDSSWLRSSDRRDLVIGKSKPQHRGTEGTEVLVSDPTRPSGSPINFAFQEGEPAGASPPSFQFPLTLPRLHGLGFISGGRRRISPLMTFARIPKCRHPYHVIT